MRDKLSEMLTESGLQDSRFHIISGDHGYALFDLFRKNCSSQFINAGICEQAIVGYAAGFSKKGLFPVVYGLASFIPMRVLEFIKMQVCYENLKVLFIGDGAGLVYSTLGSSHQCGEDIGAMNLLPNMRIYSPCDKFELADCYIRATSSPGPAYLRIGKSDRPKVHTENSQSLENAYLLNEVKNKNIAFVAIGSMVSPTLNAVKDRAMVVSIPFFSDFNLDNFNKLFRDVTNIVVVEEHVKEGGLYSKFCDLNNQAGFICKLLHIGLEKKFTLKGCDYQTALEEHHLSDPILQQRIDRCF
jgi:transketolase